MHELRPLNRQRDEPNTRSSFAKVVQLMGETGDWKNLPAWLEGLKIAKRSVKGDQMEKMVRRACEGGRLGVINECLRRVERTGLGLWDVRVSRECMWGAIENCVQSGWSEEGVHRAVRYVDNVWELMVDPKHAEDMTSDMDPKKRPEILGIMVLMHACKVAMSGDAKDEDGTVAKFTELMLGKWNNTELKLQEQNSDDVDLQALMWNINYKMLLWAPVWRAATVAQKVLGPSKLGEELGMKMSNELEPFLQKGQAILSARALEGGKRRGLKMYDDLSQVLV